MRKLALFVVGKFLKGPNQTEHISAGLLLTEDLQLPRFSTCPRTFIYNEGVVNRLVHEFSGQRENGNFG